MKLRREVQGVIFRRQDHKKELLLVKKLGLKIHSYRWRLLKGGVETGETERRALEREIFEEVGLRNAKVLDKIYSYSFSFGNIQHTVSSYSVEALSSESVKLQTPEVVDYLWTTRERALDLLYWKDEKQAVHHLE